MFTKNDRSRPMTMPIEANEARRSANSSSCRGLSSLGVLGGFASDANPSAKYLTWR